MSLGVRDIRPESMQTQDEDMGHRSGLYGTMALELYHPGKVNQVCCSVKVNNTTQNTTVF